MALMRRGCRFTALFRENQGMDIKIMRISKDKEGIGNPDWMQGWSKPIVLCQ